MNLSKHFTLEELTASETAARLDIDNIPSQAEVQNLRDLCEFILEPLREGSGKLIVINSAYRCLALNRVLKSKDTSDHVKGLAADIKIPGMTPLNVCGLVVMLNLPFKQCILEGGNTGWTHVSLPPRGTPPKREKLTAVFKIGSVTYLPGFVP